MTSIPQPVRSRRGPRCASRAHGGRLGVSRVTVVSRRTFAQFEGQALSNRHGDERLATLFLRPTCATQSLHCFGRWSKVHSKDSGSEERGTNVAALKKAVEHSGIGMREMWG